jgi:hypothetical protein
MDGEAPVTDNQRFMFHLGYFLSKFSEGHDKLAAAVKQDHPTFDDETVSKVMTCFEENTPSLVKQIDKVCSTDNGKQDELVSKSLEAYISWCVKQSTKQA